MTDVKGSTGKEKPVKQKSRGALSGMRVYLVGPMGSGKSTIGRSLALALHLPFADLDTEAERQAGRSIKSIFADSGEECFRDLETSVLEASLSETAVIATGGGVVMREHNRQVLKTAGLVCYLRAVPEVQYRRTLRDHSRPLLEAEDRLLRLQQIFAVRDPLYTEVSSIIIDSGSASVHECVQFLRRAVRLRWRQRQTSSESAHDG